MEINPLANTNTETRVAGAFYNRGVKTIGMQSYIQNIVTQHYVDAAGKGVTPKATFYNATRQFQFTYRISRLHRGKQTGTYLKQGTVLRKLLSYTLTRIR